MTVDDKEKTPRRAKVTDTASEAQVDELSTESTPGTTTAGELWRNPAGTPGRGSQTGGEAERPRDREANDGGGQVPAGFTQTGSSGSTGGRATYGIANDFKGDARDVEKDDD